MRSAGSPKVLAVNNSTTLPRRRISRAVFYVMGCVMGCSTPVSAQDHASALDPLQATQARELVMQAAKSMSASINPLPQPGGARVDVQVGRLDPRLRLAPCRRTEAYLPAGQQPLGRTRVGLRCVEGITLWNITLPVTVSVYAPGIVAREALAAGTVLSASHLKLADIDWGADAGRAHADTAALLGRELARPLSAGHTVLASDLKTRQWFAAGETVQIHARGAGYVVSTDGQALSHGIEGQPVRVRTSSGRVLSGRATGDRQVEVML